jgi:hypothetical protein
MFNQSLDKRLSSWSQFRKDLETSEQPLTDVSFFWKDAPFIPYNREIDPYNQRSWPTPWEIISTNKYDDYTNSIMIAWTIKLPERFKNSRVEIRTYIDSVRNLPYNCVVVDEQFVVNYLDNEVVNYQNLPPSFRLENLVELNRPR